MADDEEYFDVKDEVREQSEGYEQEIRAKYALVFGTGIGRDVLSDLLWRCNYGRQLDPGNANQLAYHNLAVAILGLSGVGQSSAIEGVMSRIVTATK